ncbi:MAG: hypothetical protein Q4G05_04765 [Clostridia bacterium]|nr:hypothetical protein [Clostridia bacterium]
MNKIVCFRELHKGDKFSFLGTEFFKVTRTLAVYAKDQDKSREFEPDAVIIPK